MLLRYYEILMNAEGKEEFKEFVERCLKEIERRNTVVLDALRKRRIENPAGTDQRVWRRKEVR